MTTVRIEREVAGSLADAFRAFTDVDVLARWWWPHLPDSVYRLDPRPGGSISVRSAIADIGFHGTFTTVEPPTRLAFTWIWTSAAIEEARDTAGGSSVDEDAEQGVETVDIVFTAVTEARTRVLVSHTSTDQLSQTDGVGQGWNDVMDRLAALDPTHED
jgi:uncharacterized protein YndB with AHSA1/START domain